MNKNRLWLIGSVLAMIVVVLLGWVVGIQPQLDAASAADLQRASVDATNTKNQAALVKLRTDYENLDALKSKLSTLSKSVPISADLPEFVNELNAQAASHGVTLSGFTFADAQAYKPVAPPVVASPASTSTPAPTASPAPVAPAPVVGVPPATSPLITATNFASIPVTVTVSGPYSNVIGFVNGLQTGDRLFLVTNIGTTPGDSGGSNVNGHISGLIFVLVQPTATPAGK